MAPRARRDGISRAQSGHSVFLHDARSGKVHELNATAARVFDLCDGERGVPQIAAALSGPSGSEGEALVLATLAQLDHAGLTEAPTPEAAGYSRRLFASSVLAPLVMSIFAPAPATAGSAFLNVDGGVGVPPDLGPGDGALLTADNNPITGFPDAGPADFMFLPNLDGGPGPIPDGFGSLFDGVP